MESKTHSHQIYNVLSIAGLILLLISIFIWTLWIVTFDSNPSASQAEKVKILSSYFPPFLRSISSISLTVLASTAGSILFTLVGRTGANNLFRVVGLVVIIVAGVLLLLQLFSML